MHVSFAGDKRTERTAMAAAAAVVVAAAVVLV